MTNANETYGFELIIDLHGCDVDTFNRTSLRKYFKALCTAIEMECCDLYFWDDAGVPENERQSSPRTKGTSAVQFILTSTIVIHTLDLLKSVYVNIFSCKDFDRDKAEQITKQWFGATECKARLIERV